MSSPLRALAVAFLLGFATQCADAASFAGTFALQNHSTGQCVSVAGTAVILASCSKASSGPQAFTARTSGNGDVVLKNAETHRCLSNSQTGVVLADCDPVRFVGETFQSIDTGNGAVLLKSRSINRCLSATATAFSLTWCDSVHYGTTTWTTISIASATSPPTLTSAAVAAVPVPVPTAPQPLPRPPAAGVVKPFLKSGFHLGVFSGGTDPAAADGYSAWLGRKIDYNVEFSSATEYRGNDPLPGSVGWAVGVWKKANRPDRNMMFSISLATKADPSLAHVAAGQYDDAFTETAQHIAASYPNAVIRIGWEFNGGWYPWAAKGRQQDYINAFRRVSRIFTTVSPTFAIDWCTAFGKFQFSPDQAYPGDDVVDVIGTDAYDNVQYDGAGGDPVKRWKLMVEQSYGLA